MGDLVQTLPALTDAAKAIPGIRFDWVVDESFADVAGWHPNVDRIMRSGFRRWRKSLAQSLKQHEPQAFLRSLRAQKYDFIVDLQGELKSAVATRLARGRRLGHDKRGVHEWGAQFAYRQKFSAPKGRHSIERMRRLLSQALQYDYEADIVDYGIDRSRLPPSPLQLDSPYIVFIHSTSWTSKNWPEKYWQALAAMVRESKRFVVLPWGTDAERQRAESIRQGNDQTIVLPSLSISEKAAIIAKAQATVGLDTGLSHIAAALDVPSITIYGATDPALVGATGKHQIHLTSAFSCVKCHEHECFYQGEAEFKPACLVEITPEVVWRRLETILRT
jgi:heptosyltransferase-1